MQNLLHAELGTRLIILVTYITYIHIYICGECKCKVTYFKCNLNLPKNIKKKYIFILNRVATYRLSLPRSICERLIFPFFYMKKKAKSSSYFSISRYIIFQRSSLNIGLKTAFTGFLTGLCRRKKIDLRGIFKQNIHIINVRDVNIGVWTDIYNLRNGAKENKIGVK